MPIASDDKADNPFLLTIELTPPDSELTRRFPSWEDAKVYVEKQIGAGYVITDHGSDTTNRLLSIFPLARVRAFRISRPVPITAPTAASRRRPR